MERLQKVIASYGYASRRKAEDLIRHGKVLVNGKVITELGTKVETNDIYGAFISVHVPAGEHNITLKYTPVNLILGCIITSLCIIILIGIYFFKRMCRMNVISTDSWPVLIQELICEDDVILMDRRKTETQSIYDDDINPHDSPMPLDDFSLDELDDFDNLDSDESNHAD